PAAHGISPPLRPAARGAARLRGGDGDLIHEGHMTRQSLAMVAAAATMIAACGAHARPFIDPRAERNDAIDQAAPTEPRDPACPARPMAATGGAMPRSAHTLAVRWTGYGNFELVYGGHILLLDAYYDRGSLYPSLGVTAGDIRRADAILIGHGHFDHMSDAAA